MTYRETLVDRAQDELSGAPIGSGYYQTTIGTDEARQLAEAVVRAVLPQIHNVAELDALYQRAPRKTVLLDQLGDTYRLDTISGSVVELYGPLTIVWQP